jgi:hypothetical protein
MQQIVISTQVGGFVPERTLLNALFAVHPEVFAPELWEPEEFGLTAGSDDAELDLKLMTAVIADGKVRVLWRDERVRTLPWLVAEVQRRQGLNCTWRGGPAVVVEVPDGVDWYVYVDDNGSESVHEKHRVWA